MDPPQRKGMAYWFRHGLCYTTQSFTAISLFTVWVPTMIGVCQALSVLISVVIFRFFVALYIFYFFSMVAITFVPI